jgi:hypothetical protein
MQKHTKGIRIETGRRSAGRSSERCHTNGELACARVGGDDRESGICIVDPGLKDDLTSMAFISEGSIFGDQEMVEDGSVMYLTGLRGDSYTRARRIERRQLEDCRTAEEEEEIQRRIERARRIEEQQVVECKKSQSKSSKSQSKSSKSE